MPGNSQSQRETAFGIQAGMGYYGAIPRGRLMGSGVGWRGLGRGLRPAGLPVASWEARGGTAQGHPLGGIEGGGGGGRWLGGCWLLGGAQRSGARQCAIDRSGRWPQGAIPVSGCGCGSSAAGSASAAASLALTTLRSRPLLLAAVGPLSHLVRFRFRFRAQCASSGSSARRHLACQRPLRQEPGIDPTSPADRVPRLQLLRLPPPRLPRCLYASHSSRPARLTSAVNLFHLRTTV
jgi:hypothetical protein